MCFYFLVHLLNYCDRFNYHKFIFLLLLCELIYCCCTDLAVWWKHRVGSLLQGRTCLQEPHAVRVRQNQSQDTYHLNCECYLLYKPFSSVNFIISILQILNLEYLHCVQCKHLQNYMRVVEVWLDPEYRDYFYTREPTIRGYPIGDISQQLAFKEQHKCRSFKWFLENVATEVLEKYPAPPPNIGWGEVGL